MSNEGHTNVKRQFRVTKGNHRNLTKVLLMLIVYEFFYSAFFCQKSRQLLSYKSDTRFFFQSVLLQPLEAVLVRTNYKSGF